MGILDDAIREHLDLKRQHGADDSEVKQLEDEAFGPPTRPGEPDFPGSEEQAVVGGAAAEAAQADDAGSEDATALLDTTAPVATPASAEPEPAEPEPGPPATEQPALEPSLEPDSAKQPAAEPAPEGGAFYDQAGDAEAASEPAQPISEEHPIESFETVEHPMEDLLADEAGVELEDEGPAAPEPAPPPLETEEEHLGDAAPETGEERPPVEHPEGEGEAAGEEDEDVLEETPEFLRDQPEDDELWFEQGEPKDFDF